MSDYRIGHLHEAPGAIFRIPRSSYDTHWHLIGGTGTGKTTAIHSMLHRLLLDPLHQPCVIVIDRMGNQTFDILRWATSEFCTEEVRRRIVYIEPSREDVVLGFNPLIYETEAHAYYRVARAAEIILRGWASQDLEAMPRLARWLHNSFYASALLGLTIADTVHLLLPGSPYHRMILDCLPPRLKCEWSELIDSRAAEVTRTLESTKNRLRPFFESPLLRNMFGATTNRFDVGRFMREGLIVVLNLAQNNRVPEQVGDAIGGLVINEVLTTARSLPPGLRFPTYLFLDEFQRFVGPDIEFAIPEVRQLGIKMVFSHQAMSQLERGDSDLTSIIFQLQSRMIFGVQGEDADLLATELASLQFDPRRIKDEIYSRRQRLAGHRLIELSSWSEAENEAKNWTHSYGQNWSHGRNVTRPEDHSWRIHGDNSSSGRSDTSGQGGSSGTTRTTAGREALMPIHEDFLELAARTYVTFDEDRHVWGGEIRRLRRGSAFIRVVNNPQLYRVDIERDMPGHLGWDVETLAREMPEAVEAVERFKEENFRSDFFVSPAVIEAETRERLERLRGGPLRIAMKPETLDNPQTDAHDAQQHEGEIPHPQNPDDVFG